MAKLFEKTEVRLPDHLKQRFERLGVRNPEAMSWLVKALHPACNGHTEPGIPDATLVKTVRPEFRIETTIAKQGGVPGANWDCVLFCPPGDVTGVMWTQGEAGAEFGNPSGAALDAGFAKLQTTYLADGPNLVGVNNAFSGTAAVVPSPTKILMTSSDCSQWRTTYSSVTAYLNASSTSDQGMVYGAQVTGRELPTKPQWGEGGGVPYGVAPVTLIQPVNLPLSEDEILRYTPNPYVSAAKNGVYMPIVRNRFDGGYVKKTSYAQQQPFFTGTTVDRYIVPTSPYDVSASVVGGVGRYVEPYSYDATDPHGIDVPVRSGWFPKMFGASGTGQVMGETSLDDMAIPVILFRGLDADATISIKRIVGFEQVPLATAGSMPFIRNPTGYCPKAIDLYMQITAILPHAFPASYNSWGTILHAIGKVVSDIAPALSLIPRVGPILSGVASAGGHIASSIANADPATHSGASMVRGPSVPRPTTAKRPQVTLALRARSTSRPPPPKKGAKKTRARPR